MAFRVLSMIPLLTISYLSCLLIVPIWAKALIHATGGSCVQKRCCTLGELCVELHEVAVGLLMDIVVLSRICI
jgi:hypothetical protein